MFETIDNSIQFIGVAICLILSIHELLHRHDKIWELMTLFYGSFFLGDMYWLLYLILQGDTPQFYISDLNWYAAYIFLGLVLYNISPKDIRHKRYRLAGLLPIVAVIMCAFYMQWGDYAVNIITAILMSMLIYQGTRGVQYVKEAGDHRSILNLYILTLLFCATEYLMWTMSCFFTGNGIDNPYYWFDILLTIWVVCFFSAVKRILKDRSKGESV